MEQFQKSRPARRRNELLAGENQGGGETQSCVPRWSSKIIWTNVGMSRKNPPHHQVQGRTPVAVPLEATVAVLSSGPNNTGEEKKF